MDKWDRKTNFNCESCMFWVEKQRLVDLGGKKVELDTKLGRCRRYAPTMKGYPVVYSCDWCGEHKIGSNPVRDSKKPVTKEDVINQKPWGKDQIFHHCGVLGNIKPYPKVLCSQCCHTNTDDDFNAFEEIKRLYFIVAGEKFGTKEEKVRLGQFPCEECCLKYTKEKAKIKAEIEKYLCSAVSYAGLTPRELAEENMKLNNEKIRKLLEKL